MYTNSIRNRTQMFYVVIDHKKKKKKEECQEKLPGREK